MTISIIVSVHNRANYLSNSIGSWFSKPTLPDKILVIDDRSTEDIFGTVSIFCQHHPEWKDKFHYYRVKDDNQGWRNPGICHNFGVKKCGTDHYVILDPETMFVNDCIAATRRWLDARPTSFVNAGIHYETNFKYYSDFNPFDMSYVIRKAKMYLGFPPHFDGWEVCYLDNSYSHAYAAGHTANYIKIGGKDETMVGWGWEDVDIRNRMHRNGFTHDTTNDIAIIHVGHGLVRVHPWGFPEDKPELEPGIGANEAILHRNDAHGVMIGNEGEWGVLPIEWEQTWLG